jgi:hypothetical protein
MYIFETPTTSTLSYSDFFVDRSDKKEYEFRFPEVTQARTNVRAVLKEMKGTEGNDKDYLRLVKVRLSFPFRSIGAHEPGQLLEEYLPQLQGLMDCVTHDEIGIKSEPSLSLSHSPRIAGSIEPAL